MSRTATETGTISVHPSGQTDNTYAYLNNKENAYTDETSTTYATIGLVTGSSMVTRTYFTFNTSAIPSNATITSVSCVAKGYVSNASSKNVASRTMQMCTGTTQKGSGSQLTTTAKVVTLTVGTWTRSELTNARLRFYAKRGTSNTSTDYYMRCYGATLTVEYSYETTYYEINASSTASGVTVAPSSQEVESGHNGTVTISGVTGGLSSIIVTDNGVDVTSTLVQQGNNYICYVNSIAADHTIVVSAAAPVVTIPFRVKQNGAWVTPTKVYAKSGGTWHEVTKTLTKQNGT